MIDNPRGHGTVATAELPDSLFTVSGVCLVLMSFIAFVPERRFKDL